MKNSIKHLLMLCLFGIISIGASAANIPNNEIWYEASAQLTETTSLYDSGLHTNAFNTTITSHTFSEGRGIITFNADVTSIGNYAFYYCSGLTSVTIPNSVTSIGEYAFAWCSGLTSVTIPNSVTSIGEDAFSGCTSLPVEDNLRYADTYLVKSVDYSVSTYKIKQGTKWIGSKAFYSSTKLTSVEIPNSVTSIGNSAFDGCSGLKSVIIPNSVTSINDYAFYMCSGLKSATIGNSVTSIGKSAFYGCTGMTSVVIPNSVTSIGNYAFENCSGLKSATIGNSVTEMGEEVFSGCKYLPIIDNIRYADTYLVEATDKTLSTYNIKEGTKWIGYEAFASCKLTSIELPNSLISIGNSAFDGCSGLKSVEIPNSVTSIGSEAFSSCRGLTSVTIGNSVTSIGSEAFSSCFGLTSVTIPNSVTSIGNEAFRGCTGLTSVTIGNSVTSIGDVAFYGCSGLTSVTIPNSVTSIGYSAFADCSGLTSVYVGWTVSDKIPKIYSSDFPYSTCDLYVPAGTKEIYQSKSYWGYFKTIVALDPIIITNADGTDGSIAAIVGGKVDLNDNIQSISIAEVIANVNITYTRNFDKAGVWQAWYMPFDVAFDDMKDAYDVAQIHGVLLDKDNNAVLAFLKLDKGTVKANTPYVVRPKKSGEVAITTTTDLQPTQSNSFLMMSATDKYTIGGVFEKTTTPGNWYALNLDGQFQLMGSGVYLRPFRIYMTIDPRTDNPYAQSASTTAKMDIVVLGDDEPTGITSYENPSHRQAQGKLGSGQAQNDNIYNLNGQRVNSIQKGQIYIMNGKKFIAK